MKKLTSLLATISVLTASGIGYVSYKNVTNSNNIKKQNMLNKIKSIQKDLKNRELKLKSIEKTLIDKENKRNQLNDQIKNLESYINDLNSKEKISKDNIDKLNANLIKINKEINDDKKIISIKETEIKSAEQQAKENKKNIIKILNKLFKKEKELEVISHKDQEINKQKLELENNKNIYLDEISKIESIIKNISSKRFALELKLSNIQSYNQKNRLLNLQINNLIRTNTNLENNISFKKDRLVEVKTQINNVETQIKCY
ncbi:helix-rich protein [Mycoplasma mycoides subsp. mycoides]|uniref:helix-rich protein n=1 Tax=Mycoplasma mycoides TaxID=2102 RepID=UPI003DA1D329